MTTKQLTRPVAAALLVAAGVAGDRALGRTGDRPVAAAATIQRTTTTTTTGTTDRRHPGAGLRHGEPFRRLRE